MRLPNLIMALKGMRNYKESTDGVQCSIACPFCGDSRSRSDGSHLSIKIDVAPNEPILYMCFRASCQAKGALKSSTLQEWGITNLEVLSEVSAHNKNVSKNFDKDFIVRKPKDYVLINKSGDTNDLKLNYVNKRLGTNLKAEDLSDLKIQLSIKDMLNINSIKKLGASKETIQALDLYTIGFVSIYNDFMICRDVTKDLITGKRYYVYRLSGKPDPADMRVYSIPQDIDLLDPRSCIINVAEGSFSILGAYLNTDIGRDRRNHVWLANCGAQYSNTILHVAKQYGLLKCRINIFSDSEIDPGMYRKLYNMLKNRLDIRAFTVYYNRAADDFGHPKDMIDIDQYTIYE